MFKSICEKERDMFETNVEDLRVKTGTCSAI